MLSADALSAVRSSLRSTETVVTHRSGQRTVETVDGQVTGTLPPSDVLPPALRQQQAGDQRKRLHDLMIEPQCEPSWSLPPCISNSVSRMPPVSLNSLRVATWNVWFAPLDTEDRMAALFREALDVAPDVLCLQEVVPELAASIRACAPLLSLYDISQNDVGAYGCLILARRELRAKFMEVAFPSSNMGRSLLIAEWTPPFEAGGTVAVATVHLESLNCAPERARQLRIARDALAGEGRRVVLCGDFNFDSCQNWGDWKQSWKKLRVAGDGGKIHKRPSSMDRRASGLPLLENEVLSNVLGDAYVDAWPSLRPEEAGLTFDGGINPHVADGEEQMRYDRVMVRGLGLRSIDLLGLAAAQEHHRRRLKRCEGVDETAGSAGAAGHDGDDDHDVVVPSDHFGLCAVLDLR